MFTGGEAGTGGAGGAAGAGACLGRGGGPSIACSSIVTIGSSVASGVGEGDGEGVGVAARFFAERVGEGVGVSVGWPSAPLQAVASTMARTAKATEPSVTMMNGLRIRDRLPPLLDSRRVFRNRRSQKDGAVLNFDRIYR